MRTYKIYALGCKVNQYDAGKLAAELGRAGLVKAEGRADLAVVMSCAVTQTALVKSGRALKLAKKENPRGLVVLAGCGSRAGEPDFKAADLVIKEKAVEKIARSIMTNRLLPVNKKPALAVTDRARYFIKIQDGCEQFCSYCIIPYLRGKLKSRPEAAVVKEVSQAVKAGYGEIVLSGIHLGLYGKEIKKDLAGLLKKLVKLKGLGRLRLSSIEITEVTEELIKLMAESKKICRHLHIPLQAGSDRILKLMNRPYDKKYFFGKIKQIRRAMPDAAVTTDVIIGFPGETEKDFRETKKFIEQIKFSRLHVFPYSARAGTPAAALPNRVDEKIKIRRAKILRKLGEKLDGAYVKKFKGGRLAVAVEQILPGKFIGKTEYYFNLEFKDGRILKGKPAKNGNLIGQIVVIKN